MASMLTTLGPFTGSCLRLYLPASGAFFSANCSIAWMKEEPVAGTCWTSHMHQPLAACGTMCLRYGPKPM